jgi:adenylate kinase
MNEPKTVFFIGKPGSGKGTQAKLLAERTGWTILASGAQFRAIAEEDTVVGRKVRDELAQGMLMPHWFAMYLYQRALFSVPEDTSVIFDGFNRKVEEAELNISSLEWIGRPFHVINIDVSNEEVERRLQGRAQVSGRSDDRQDAVEERLQEYKEHTLKALEIFRTKGVLIDINGEQTPDAIAADVVKALGL